MSHIALPHTSIYHIAISHISFSHAYYFHTSIMYGSIRSDPGTLPGYQLRLGDPGIQPYLHRATAFRTRTSTPNIFIPSRAAVSGFWHFLLLKFVTAPWYDFRQGVLLKLLLLHSDASVTYRSFVWDSCVCDVNLLERLPSHCRHCPYSCLLSGCGGPKGRATTPSGPNVYIFPVLLGVRRTHFRILYDALEMPLSYIVVVWKACLCV